MVRTLIFTFSFSSISSGPFQNVQVCTYNYVSHQRQFDGEEEQDVDFSAVVKLSCQSGEQAARCPWQPSTVQHQLTEGEHAACSHCVLFACFSHPNKSFSPLLSLSLSLSSSAAVGVYGSQSATRYCISLQNVQLSSDMVENTKGYAL